MMCCSFWRLRWPKLKTRLHHHAPVHAPARFSFVPFQLSLTPVRVFAIGIEHALDVTV
jgi:hypothetical protein